MELVEDFKQEVMEYDFERWTALELFYHLIDLNQIPYEEEFENWRWFKADMLRMCKETLERGAQ